MSKKLAAKAMLIQAPPASADAEGEGGSTESSSRARARTAPGSMAMFMASQSAAVKEAEELREQLRQFDGSRPVRSLDPQTVRPSRWANRHADSFADEAFAELKADIASAGTNVQPVVVRTLSQGSKAEEGGHGAGLPAYELVFGHRRHRACLELGLPLQAMVCEMDDRALFEAMDRENRARKNLSAWEQGAMYRRALDEGLYPSQRRLAESLGVDVSLVSKALALARLPEAVVAAFQSPLELQFRWAQPLSDALQKDPEGVLRRAAKIRQSGASWPATRKLAMLLSDSAGVLNRSTPEIEIVEGAHGRRAKVTRDAKGGVTIRFERNVIGEKDQERLTAVIREILAAPSQG